VVAPALDLVPADVGERWGVLEPSRAPPEDAERRRAILVAALEEELQSQADADERAVVGDPAPDRLDEPGSFQPLHRRRRRADAGHDERIGVPRSSPVARTTSAPTEPAPARC
jgi:hypothetical protein